jgi:broad specificity phosphatase PhoE
MSQNYKRRIYFLRHGQTDCNKNGLWYCPEKTHINETGMAQAQGIADIITSINPDKVYCSPFQRCMDTANIVLKNLPNHGFTVRQCLMERNFEGIEGLTEKDVMDEYGVWMEQSPITGRMDSIPRIEKSVSFNIRVRSCIDQIIGETGDCENILIVTHGGVIYSFVYQKLNIDPRPDPFYNCALLGLEIERNSFRPILSINIRKGWYRGAELSSSGQLL